MSKRDREQEDEGGFAGRWSRMKQAAKAPVPEAEPAAGAVPAEAALAPDERPDSEVLEELGLPEPESLQPGDDFSAFMAKAVPERIRNRALRRLWITDPVLANVDGLVEYGGDFTDAATVVENLQTVYKVGRGMLDRLTEAPDDAAEGASDESGETTPDQDVVAESESGDAAASGSGGVAEAPAPESPVWPAVPAASRREAGQGEGQGCRPRARIRFRVAEE